VFQTGYTGFQHEVWLLARCLADQVRAQAWVDEALAKLAKSTEKSAFYDSGLMQLAEVLTTPPERRLRILMGQDSGLFVYDE